MLKKFLCGLTTAPLLPLVFTLIVPVIIIEILPYKRNSFTRLTNTATTVFVLSPHRFIQTSLISLVLVLMTTAWNSFLVTCLPSKCRLHFWLRSWSISVVWSVSCNTLVTKILHIDAFFKHQFGDFCSFDCRHVYSSYTFRTNYRFVEPSYGAKTSKTINMILINSVMSTSW